MMKTLALALAIMAPAAAYAQDAEPAADAPAAAIEPAPVNLLPIGTDDATVYGPPAPRYVAEPASSDDYRIPPDVSDDRSFVQKIGPNRLIAHSVAAGLDAYSTYRCSTKRRTCKEANPAMRAIVGKRMSGGEAILAFGVMEAIYIGGSVAIGETLGYDSKARDVFQITLIGSHGAAAGLNFRF